MVQSEKERLFYQYLNEKLNTGWEINHGNVKEKLELLNENPKVFDVFDDGIEPKKEKVEKKKGIFNIFSRK